MDDDWGTGGISGNLHLRAAIGAPVDNG
jgi:hypothetical protein